jgi:formaldehyde-activating enzyme involved in methanogenesis|tara:strand:- start:975 stop:1202 length:228 start_codon:yes stop_codon:yes gene_type:complete
MSSTNKKIKDTDLTIDRLENLAKLVVDKWEIESLVQFAEEQVFQEYQYDIDRAVEDAEDYTLEELDNEQDRDYWR